jgi:hypothetical protein
MRTVLAVAAGASLLCAVLLTLVAGSAGQPAEMSIAAPEFKDVDEWINSKPLQVKDLRGNVVVVHFWTFG